MDGISPLSGVFESFGSVPVIREVLGGILVFFLPGFAWTLVFFRRINVLERIALSFGLSIALVTLSILTLNRLIGVRITALNSVLIILAITVIPVAIYYFRRFMRRKAAKTED